MGAPKELTGPTTVKGRVGSLKSISTSDDLVGWYKRLLVRVPEPVVHADRMTDTVAKITTVLIYLIPPLKSFSAIAALAPKIEHALFDLSKWLLALRQPRRSW